MITYTKVSSNDADFQKLVKELDKYLAVINGTENDFFAQYNKIDKIDHVIMAYEGDMPVGCGAIKEYEKDAMEVKRMFVPVEMRGKGIASGVLHGLEKWAMELNYSKTVLETSKQLTAAIALYKKSAYQIIPNYGQYKNVATSICFEKVLKSPSDFSPGL